MYLGLIFFVLALIAAGLLWYFLVYVPGQQHKQALVLITTGTAQSASAFTDAFDTIKTAGKYTTSLPTAKQVEDVAVAKLTHAVSSTLGSTFIGSTSYTAALTSASTTFTVKTTSVPSTAVGAWTIITVPSDGTEDLATMQTNLKSATTKVAYTINVIPLTDATPAVPIDTFHIAPASTS
jgi:hypothetical protein